MTKTGKEFDMNPETFTLANIFAMDLHNFIDTIGDIVTAAAKELGIERVGARTNIGTTEFRRSLVQIRNRDYVFFSPL